MLRGSLLINREFTVSEPDKVWVGDITYIATGEGWVFLAVAIDLFSRQVVGWSLRDDMTRDIVIDALRMAWFKRQRIPRILVKHSSSWKMLRAWSITRQGLLTIKK